MLAVLLQTHVARFGSFGTIISNKLTEGSLGSGDGLI